MVKDKNLLLNQPDFKGCFSKDTKRGIKIALDEIKNQKRFDLEWEWMAENKTGEYIKVNDIINKLQMLLKNCV